MEPIFNQNEFALLLKKAMGGRSINQYSLHSQVSATYISKLLRMLVPKPPGALVIKKLADKAQNGVDYEELLAAAGHLTRTTEAKNVFYEFKEGISEYNSNIIALPVVNMPTAGSTDIPDRNTKKYMEFSRELAEGATFALRVDGNSMTDMGIYDGDHVVIKEQSASENGKTVLVVIDDMVTIKRYYKIDNQVRLEPAKNGHRTLEEQEFKIIGEIIALTRKFV